MRYRRAWRRLVLPTAIVAALGAPASSQPAPGAPPAPSAPPSTRTNVELAAEHYQRGTAAIDAGRLDDALAELLESYGLWPRTQTLYAIAALEHELGHRAAAANHIAAYLAQQDRDPALATRLAAIAVELDGTLGRLTLHADAGLFRIDGAAAGSGPGDLVVRVDPGEHEVEQGGRTHRVRIAGGATVSLDLTPPVLVVHARPAPTRWYLVSGAATVVVAAATAYAGWETRRDQRTLDAIAAMPTSYDYADAVAARDRADRHALVTNVLLGTTIAGALATAALFVWRPRAAHPVAVIPHARGLALAVHW